MRTFRVIVLVLFFNLLVSCKALEKPKVSGETNYERSNIEALRTKLKLDYKMNIYEDPEKRWLLHTGGNVAGDYDHFGNTVKVNAFSTVGIDF